MSCDELRGPVNASCHRLENRKIEEAKNQAQSRGKEWRKQTRHYEDVILDGCPQTLPQLLYQQQKTWTETQEALGSWEVQLADCSLEMEIANLNSDQLREQLDALELKEDELRNQGESLTSPRSNRLRAQKTEIRQKLVVCTSTKADASPLKAHVSVVDEWLGDQLLDTLPPDSPLSRRLRARKAKQSQKMQDGRGAAAKDAFGKSGHGAILVAGSVAKAAAAHAAAVRGLKGCEPAIRSLLTALLRPGTRSLQAAAAVLPPSAYSKYAELVVPVVHSFNQCHTLAAECIRCDISYTASQADPSRGLPVRADLSLRSESLPVRLAVQFVVHVGRQWLKGLLSPVVGSILQLDASVLLSPVLEEEHLGNQLDTQKVLMRMLDSFEGAADNLPWQIRWVMRAAYEAVYETFTNEEHLEELALAICGSLLFSRMICPAITLPQTLGIEIVVPLAHTANFNECHAQAARRKLVTVAKCLQIISNGVTRSRDTLLDRFLNSQMDRMRNFIKGLVQVIPATSPIGVVALEWEQPNQQKLDELVEPLRGFLVDEREAFMEGQDELCQAAQQVITSRIGTIDDIDLCEIDL